MSDCMLIKAKMEENTFPSPSAPPPPLYNRLHYFLCMSKSLFFLLVLEIIVSTLLLCGCIAFVRVIGCLSWRRLRGCMLVDGGG